MNNDHPGHNQEEVVDLLEKSLKYDPHDRETYFMLIARKRHNLSQQYKVVNRALEEFPEDIAVLYVAIEAAIGRGAFKKASRIAAKLLDIDPINSRARLLLINAHLDHGRKLACNGKFNLVFKECAAAASYDRSDLSQGEIEICHGLTLLLSDDRDKGLTLHNEGIKKAGSLLLGSFHASFEARLLEMPVKWVRFFDKNLRIAVKTGPDRETLIALITKIQRCNGKKVHQLQKVRKIATTWFKKGVKLELSREDYLFICSVFHNFNYYDLLQLFGQKMNKIWPGIPLGTFYHLYGLSENGGKYLSVSQLDQLSLALQAAMDQGDTKTADLIDGLLQAVLGWRGRADSGIGKFPDRSFEEIEEMFESGDIDLEDFLNFCKGIGIIDEKYGVADDDLEDDEVFVMPRQLPSGKTSKNDSRENSEGQKKPKQLDLF